MRLPANIIRRHLGGLGRPSALPPRPPQGGGPSPLSLLPFLTVAVLVLLALQLVQLAYRFATTPPAFPGNASPSGLAPSAGTDPNALTPPTLRQVAVPTRSHNLQFGNAQANHILTVFTDPACAPCRQKLDAWLKSLPTGSIRLVYKYWPQNAANITAGQLLELARRNGRAGAFWQLLEQAPADVTDAELFLLAEKAGLNLAQAQTQLQTQAEALTKVLNEDLALARTLNLGPAPVLVLDGYVIEPPLTPASLPTYLQRRRSNQPLLQPSDYFLN